MLTSPQAICRKWVYRIGDGFHPDTRGSDYSPAMEAGEIAKYDRDMDTLFGAEGDPYAFAVQAMEVCKIRRQCLIFVCFERGTDDIKSIPLNDERRCRRLAIYRRCAMQAAQNKIGVDKKLKRARTERIIFRWSEAGYFWEAVGDYFSKRIKALGEPF